MPGRPGGPRALASGAPPRWGRGLEKPDRRRTHCLTEGTQHPRPTYRVWKAPSGEPWLTPLVLVTRSHSVRDLIPSDLEARARPTEVHANFFFVEAELIQDQASELPHLEEKGKGARFLQALRHPSPCRQLRWGQETSWSYCGWHLKALR